MSHQLSDFQPLGKGRAAYRTSDPLDVVFDDLGFRVRLERKAKMKKLLIACVFMAACLVQAEQTGGTIYFRDGRAVPFESTGTQTAPSEYKISGHLGAQRVEYSFSDFKEMVLAEVKAGYSDEADSVILVSKSGERFTLTQVKFFQRLEKDRKIISGSSFKYTYLDPITQEVKSAFTQWDAVGHIEMGSSAGTLRRNPVTNEFFPARYNFDPFTGQKLEWANP
jgi:hypothetical protein